jgi:hypothetical protein
MTITWSLSRVVQIIQIDDDQKCRQIAGGFNHHADVVVQYGAHCPMEHIYNFTRSYWMLPSSECLRRIARAAVMVGNFSVKHKTLTKHNF